MPESYKSNTYKSYPVMYVLDGQVAESYVPAVTRIFADRDRAPEIIIVTLPSLGNRGRDYTPKGKGDDGVTSGGANQFLNYLEKELIPYIDKNYRTESFRILSGESRGGLFALHSFIQKAELFSAYFIFSPALYHNDQEIIHRLQNFLRSASDLKCFLYMNIGNEGDIFKVAFDSAWETFKEYPVEGLQLNIEVLPYDYHGLTSISGQHHAYSELFSNWRTPFEIVQNQGAKGVVSHFEKLSQRYGYTVKPPEDSNNSYGYTFLRRKEYDVMLGLFELNVKLYPESANAYDSLAEGLEALGKFPEAIKNMHKALEVVKDSDPNLKLYQEHLQRLLKEN
ncbi:hypothetical protein J1C55_02910 [Winogradskyella sp. E313]|uniref:Esterase n=1 Tax=Winogradskyella immobilis TaxID=2816852 RepID=A0ABS8ELU0_9FLAO|nr:hypothetical protein [Winogradskyella immobilis]